jgi:hypothetical protein
MSSSNIGYRIENKEVDLQYVDNYLGVLLGDFRFEPFMSTISRTKPDPKNINNDMGDILGSAVEGRWNENPTTDYG